MPFDVIKDFGKGKKEIKYEEPIQPEIYEILLSIIKKRRSVRKYLKKDVSDDLIEKIIESARFAPSAGNYQPWEFIVVRNEETKKDLVSAAFNQNWMLEAPVFIVTCINMRLAAAVYGERGAKLYGIQSVAAAIENMLLTAEALGLATCWVGAFSEVVVARILECPEYIRPCAIITIGYAAEEPKMPPRQSIQEFTHIEKFGETLQMNIVKKEKKPTYMKLR
ncbi:MAG: nitroreductase family protein [Candidatus Aenigmatarchaeota archaeon]